MQIDEILFDLESDIPEIKRAALIELARIGTSDNLDVLNQMIEGSDEEMKVYINKAIESISKRGDEAPMDMDEELEDLPWDMSSLVLMLNEDSVVIRQAVISRLKDLGDSGAVRYLLTRFRLEDDNRTKKLIIETIGEIGSEDSSASLSSELINSDETLRPVIIQSLGKIGGSAATKAIFSHLTSESTTESAAARSAISNMSEEQLLKAVKENINDLEHQNRLAALEALSVRDVSIDNIEDELLTAYGDEDSSVRLKAIILLGKSSSRKVYETLDARRRLGDVRERKAIEESLEKIESRIDVTSFKISSDTATSGGNYGETSGIIGNSDNDPLAKVLKSLGSRSIVSDDNIEGSQINESYGVDSQRTVDSSSNLQNSSSQNEQPYSEIQKQTTLSSNRGSAVSGMKIETKPSINANKGEKYVKSLQDLMMRALKKGGSDLHIRVGYPPMIRVGGSIREDNLPVLTKENLEYLTYSVITDEKELKKLIEDKLELDLSMENEGTRFRLNVFHEKNGFAIVLRVIPSEILTLQDLNCPAILEKLCDRSKGLVLVVGPTGSGKSTTLAAMINYINESRSEHIITVEDPIEFVHSSQRCLLTQRELRTNTPTFSSALKAALRQDPDIILVGEMRDLETIELALTAAETGHLVFSTLHTQSASQTIDRIIQVFPANQQEQIKVQLSESLMAVISQTLLPHKENKDKRVGAFEVMIVNQAIRNLIREDKTFQIESTMSTSKGDGMILMDDYMFRLLKNREVSLEDVLMKAQDKDRFVNAARDSFSECMTAYKKNEITEEEFMDRCLDENRAIEFLKTIKGQQ